MPSVDRTVRPVRVVVRLLPMLTTLGALVLLLVALLAHTPAVHAINPGDVTITMTTSPTFVSDSNNCSGGDGPHAAYIGFRITNVSGGLLSNLQVDIGDFDTAEGYDLAGGQASVQYIGTLADTESDTVYWYMKYPCHDTPSDDVITVSVSDDGFTTVVTGTGSVSPESMISANAGGLIQNAILGPGAIVGQIIEYDVTYDFGNVKIGDEFVIQPSGLEAFRADCFQLVTTEVLTSQVPGINVGDTDSLYYLATANDGGSNHPVQIRYFLQYLCDGVATSIQPYASQTSGNTLKYTGNFGTCGDTANCDIALPAATDPLQISKSVTPTQVAPGEVVTYTVLISNPSTLTTRIEQITDVLPVDLTYEGVLATSSITSGNSTQSPTNPSSGTLLWTGTPPTYYELAAGQSLTLTYLARVDPFAPDGVRTNSVTASVGKTTLGPAAANTCVNCALATTLSAFWADGGATGIDLGWESSSEVGTLGYHLWRALTAEAPAVRLNEALIQAQHPGSGQGALYDWSDNSVERGQEYFYWIEVVGASGVIERQGPVSAQWSGPTSIHLIGLESSAGHLPAGWLLLLLLPTLYFFRRRPNRHPGRGGPIRP